MKIHFIGAGGAGCYPLAGLCIERGERISGSDAADSANLRELIRMGGKMHIGHRAENLPPGTELAIYSSAVRPDNPELAEAEKRGIKTMRRGEFLAHCAARYGRTIAVSGAHGKSSISAMLAFLLREYGLEPGYVLGAKLNGGLMPFSAGKNNDLFVIESDESDGSHTLLKNFFMALIPNIDDDHEWTVGGAENLRRNFRSFAGNAGTVLYGGGEADKLLSTLSHAELFEPEKYYSMLTGRCGFDLYNAAMVMAAAEKLGMIPEKCAEILRRFPGIARRMTVRSNTPRLVVIEDYAHHPVELKNSIEWLRLNYPEHHLRVVFQPHRYARLAKYLDEFAEVLRSADEVLILPVFAAWAEGNQLSGADLARETGPAARYFPSISETAAAAAFTPADTVKPTLCAIIGAGDCDKLLTCLKK